MGVKNCWSYISGAHIYIYSCERERERDEMGSRSQSHGRHMSMSYICICACHSQLFCGWYQREGVQIPIHETKINRGIRVKILKLKQYDIYTIYIYIHIIPSEKIWCCPTITTSIIIHWHGKYNAVIKKITLFTAKIWTHIFYLFWKITL